MKMREYVLRRVLMIVPILIGVLAFTFIIAHLVPGDPVGVYLGKKANDPVLRAEVEKRFHLDKPWLEQFWYYIKGVFTGDLGYSFLQRTSVSTALAAKLPATIELVFVSSLISVPTGIYLGIVSATRRNTLKDAAARLIALIGISIPAFFLALLLQLALNSTIHVFPLGGRFPTGVDPPAHITGLYLLDSLLSLDTRGFLYSGYYIILPAIGIGLSIIGYILRMMRSSMLEVLSSDYIRTARAKGVSERDVIFKHALKNAMGPTLTVSGLVIGGAIAGTVFVERVFNWPGIGNFAVVSAMQLDFAAILGFTLVVTVAYLLANLLVDILYAYLDPQVRLGG